jgi:hypothetical protein
MRHHLRSGDAFPQQQRLINRKVAQYLLMGIGGWPADAYLVHAGGGAHADMLLHWIGAETRHRAHGAKHIALAPILVKDNLYARTIRGSVAL